MYIRYAKIGVNRAVGVGFAFVPWVVASVVVGIHCWFALHMEPLQQQKCMFPGRGSASVTHSVLLHSGMYVKQPFILIFLMPAANKKKIQIKTSSKLLQVHGVLVENATTYPSVRRRPIMHNSWKACPPPPGNARLWWCNLCPNCNPSHQNARS